jgi:hypothetical protein
MPTHLRVYRPPVDEEFLGLDEPATDPVTEEHPAIHVRLGDLLPLVSMAQKLNFIWLKDFLDDEVIITEDLHQVLQSFRGIRPSAS